ncbi:MAG: hypothetical protein GX547_16425 [Phycisphaerae bacterium]|nr:hypothetical protein [Phycisphaerae bacterium]
MTADELRTAIDAIDRAAVRIATHGVASVTIDGQTTQFVNPTELYELRKQLAARLARLTGRRPRCCSIRLPGS